jgi:carbonic anhydrase/acetyltransferase-like protein (isoleucine patch superfamily)
MTVYAYDGVSPTLPGEGRYWVAPTADVMGKVTLGEDVSIWFGAALRGDNEPIVIGNRSNIQEHVMIHTDPKYPCTVGPNCTVGHRAILHGCTLGTGTLIGMGAIVLNGAKIGANCLVGAGALVTEGKEFPDNSLIVGAPARAIRPLGEDAARQIARGADIYVRRWQQYAKGLKRIG